MRNCCRPNILGGALPLLLAAVVIGLWSATPVQAQQEDSLKWLETPEENQVYDQLLDISTKGLTIRQIAAHLYMAELAYLKAKKLETKDPNLMNLARGSAAIDLKVAQKKAQSVPKGSPDEKLLVKLRLGLEKTSKGLATLKTTTLPSFADPKLEQLSKKVQDMEDQFLNEKIEADIQRRLERLKVERELRKLDLTGTTLSEIVANLGRRLEDQETRLEKYFTDLKDLKQRLDQSGTSGGSVAYPECVPLPINCSPYVLPLTPYPCPTPSGGIIIRRW